MCKYYLANGRSDESATFCIVNIFRAVFFMQCAVNVSSLLNFVCFALQDNAMSCRAEAHAVERRPIGIKERKRDLMFQPIRERTSTAVFCVDQ